MSTLLIAQLTDRLSREILINAIQSMPNLLYNNNILLKLIIAFFLHYILLSLM